MTPSDAASLRAEKDFETELTAYPGGWRLAAGALKVLSRGGLLVTLGFLMFSDNPPTNPFKQLRLFFGLFAAPEAAAWCIARSLATHARIGDGALVLEQAGQSIEIPVSAIAAVEPWSLPLPRGGLWLRLRSGRHFSQGLAIGDAQRFVAALVAEGAAPELADGLQKPMSVYARARLAVPRNWLENPVLKFGIYSLVPAFPAFRLHQFITYGGTFGEYYTYGLKAWLLGLGLWWISFAFSLLCIAAGIRAAIELLALASAFAHPPSAVQVRRALEWTQRLAYYAGIPTWLILRFTA